MLTVHFYGNFTVFTRILSTLDFEWPHFLHFLKKSLQSISFELLKGSLERELLCYQKRVRILRLFGRRWKQQSHGSRLPHRGLCESRKPEKKVQTQFTSWIQNILYLWISASKTAVFGVKIQIDKKSR